MSKQIYTYQTDNKQNFDEDISLLIKVGCELVENTYQINQQDGKILYSQVVYHEFTDFYFSLHKNGRLKFINGDNLSIRWWENGNKKEIIEYNEDGCRHGISNRWDKNGEWIYGCCYEWDKVVNEQTPEKD
jgi:hypothetical protein